MLNVMFTSVMHIWICQNHVGWLEFYIIYLQVLQKSKEIDKARNSLSRIMWSKKQATEVVC